PLIDAVGGGAAFVRRQIEQADAKRTSLRDGVAQHLCAYSAAHRFYERLGFARSHEGFKMVLD
uniref:hypothetical protein n=1 Tax=Serratia marcescens TaxID=615 RepID=UPI001EF8BD1A